MTCFKAMIYWALYFALSVSVPAWAGEQTFRISCSKTSQASFDEAVAALGAARSDAGRLFQEMAHKDPECAILYWGLAKTADDPATQQRWSVEAIYQAAVGDVNDAERRHIAALPTQ